jgi:PAS domain S-box-containing protein
MEIATDITERKQAEERLKEREERYRRLLDSGNDAIYVHSINDDGYPGLFTEVNDIACSRLGYTREEMLRMSPADIDAPELLEKLPETIQRLLKEGHCTFEMTHIAGDGRKIPVEINAHRFTHQGQSIVISIARDITERRRSEEEKSKLQNQLQQSQKMESVGRLAGGVAHDFNNMLGVILGHAEVAMERVDPAQPIHADLREIHKAAERSANLTRQLLAFARKQTIAPRIIDVNETATGMLKMLQRLIGEDIHLAWLPGVDVWPVMADPSQIDQLLANLCVNARDAIAGVGKVTIETGNAVFDEAYCADHLGFVPGEYALLAVSDDGCGMDKETIDHIFEPFYTTKGVGEGTGLGLATVYGIVKQNSGFINVYSEPERGTTFKIYLPRHLGATDREKVEEPQGPALRGLETVLVVEDEPSLLKLAAMLLEAQGYTVLAAGTPGEAIRLAEERDGKIDLLMTDVVMPEMNGRELAQRLLALHPHLKCLFTSGYTSNVIAHHGVLHAGVCFLQKPFSRRDLAEKVREALDQKI